MYLLKLTEETVEQTGKSWALKPCLLPRVGQWGGLGTGAARKHRPGAALRGPYDLDKTWTVVLGFIKRQVDSWERQVSEPQSSAGLQREPGYRNLKVLVAQSCPTLCSPMGCSPRPLSVGFSSKNTAVGNHSHLQGIFLTQGWNLGCIAGRFFIIWASRKALQEFECLRAGGTMQAIEQAVGHMGRRHKPR